MQVHSVHFLSKCAYYVHTLETSLHAIVQGFCKFDNINKLPVSNILDSSMVSNVTIVLHCFALTLLPW